MDIHQFSCFNQSIHQQKSKRNSIHKLKGGLEFGSQDILNNQIFPEYSYADILNNHVKIEQIGDLYDRIPSVRIRRALGGQYPRVVLFGDLLIDMNTLSVQMEENNAFQVTWLIQHNRIMKHFEKKQIIFFKRVYEQQLIDFEGIIKALQSLQNSQAYELSKMLEFHQFQTRIQLERYKTIINKESSEIEKVMVCSDPEDCLKKALDFTSKIIQNQDELFSFNLLLFDPEKKRLIRYVNSSSYSLIQLFGDNEEEVINRFLHGTFNLVHGVFDFLKIQVPYVKDMSISQPIKIFTFDHFVLPAFVCQTIFKVSENSFNLIMLRRYSVDTSIIQELKRVREIFRKKQQQFQFQRRCSGDPQIYQNTSNSFQNQDFHVETFLQRSQIIDFEQQ